MFFLTVNCIRGEDNAGQSEVSDHLLGGWNLVRFAVDFGMCQDNGMLTGECRQCLRRFAVVYVIEAAAQHLAVKRDHRPLARRRRQQDGGGMTAEGRFEIPGVQGLKDRPQRVESRSPLKMYAKTPIEVVPALLQERDDAAIGPGTAQQRQHREHQQMRQRITLALAPPWIRDLRQSRQKMGKWNHGTLLKMPSIDSQPFVQR
jgi:hypothetical protein